MSVASLARDAGGELAPTRRLAEFAASLRGDRLPMDIRTALGELFLDYIRVASIGADMPWSVWANSYMAQFGGTGNATVLFRPERRDPVRAAFLNTTYAGSIDSDDTHVGSMLHPGSIVFSAALATADELGATGRDFVAAVAAGYETMIRIGLSLQPTHFQRGFQSTATCGGFGAGIAAARIAFNQQQDAERKLASTIVLVASFAGGLTQFYKSGSTVKRIHAARAAENGVAAAFLARAGFSGPDDILEGSNGFARAYADAADFSIITNGLGTDFAMRELTIKAHACSARVQAAVEGILDLCKANNIDPENVADVLVGIPAVILGRLTIPRPVDVQAAQMSLPHSAALALAMGRSAGPGFTLSVTDYERSLTDRTVKALEQRVRCEVDPQVEAATTAQAVPARVTITMRDGTQHSAFVAAPKGSPSRPFTHEDHVARFQCELSKRWPDGVRREVIEIAENLSDLDKVSRITALLASRSGV